MSDTAVNAAVVLAGTEQQEPIQTVLTPGAQLAAQRQTRGWSIEEVAMQLNLAPRQILAIETNNYAALPGMASVRGFIRAYAKILKIDAAPLLAMVTSETANLGEPMSQRRALSAPFLESRLPPMGKQGLSSRSMFLSACLVLLVVGALLGVQMGWVSAMPDVVSGTIKELTSASTPIHNAPDSGVVTVAASGASSITAGSTNISMISEPITPGLLVAAQPALAEQHVVAPVDAPAIVSKNSSKNALILKLHQDSWIEITRAGSNTPLISRLLKAGATETFEISEPVSMIVGNVAGVDASLRGTPLDLKSGTKSNVIRLSLK